MAGQGYQVPDLASVLKTLASFAPAPQGNSQHSRPQTPEPRKTREAPPSMKPESSAAVNSLKIIDPATITDWPSGLRCVMKTVAANENIIKEIRRMIKVQHEHEEQWWAGRQDLLRRQSTRKESQRKLDEVLSVAPLLHHLLCASCHLVQLTANRRAVGGAVAEKPAAEEDFAEELRTFDGKVYRAQVQMVKEMSAKLKGYGVPFFGTRGDLVRREGEVKVGGVERGGKGEGIDGMDDKRIGEAELVELQRRMIGILEDLCRE